MKRQATDWGKIFTKHRLIKDLCSEHTRTQNPVIKKNNLIQDLAKDLKWCFTKEDTKFANKLMKRRPRSLVSREVQIKPHSLEERKFKRPIVPGAETIKLLKMNCSPKQHFAWIHSLNPLKTFLVTMRSHTQKYLWSDSISV